jgi:hypothetical protein
VDHGPAARRVVTQSTGIATQRTKLRPGQWRCKLAAIFLLGIFPVAASAGGNGNAVYDGTIQFGPQVVQLGDGCAAVDGGIASGAFFDDLKRVEVGRQFEFTKHGHAVKEYPDSLSTSILIVGGPCESTLSNPASLIFQGKSYALRFQVDWKDGMQLRPATLSPVSARCTGYSSIQSGDRRSAVASLLCQLTVASRGVPLGDHLIVSIFAPDGTRVARLSARP